jgi:hypothetical protein
MRDLLSYIRPRQQVGSGQPLEPSAILHVVVAFGTSDTRRADDDEPVNVDARRLAVLLPPSLDLPDEIIS